MNEKIKSKYLDKFFDSLRSDLRAMTPDERTRALQDLKAAFNQRVEDLNRYQSEVEYGQHVEGLYNINSREAYLYDGGWKFRC